MSLVTRMILSAALLGSALVTQLAARRYFEGPGPLPSVELRRELADFPVDLSAWHGVDEPPESELSLYGDDHLRRAYTHSQRGQQLTLWIAYSRLGVDRGHHPEVCMRAAGQAEDRNARRTCPVDGLGDPVQQYRFGRAGNQQWVFYWHYTLPPPPNESLTQVQKLYQRMRRRQSSLTLEVFAPASSADDAEHAREFVRLVDAAIRDHVGATAIRGSRRLPVTLVEPERVPKSD